MDDSTLNRVIQYANVKKLAKENPDIILLGEAVDYLEKKLKLGKYKPKPVEGD